MGILQYPLVVSALAIAGVLLIAPLPVASADSGMEFKQENDFAIANSCNFTANGTITLPKNLPKGLCIITVQRNVSDESVSYNYTALYFSTLNLKAQDYLVIYDGNYSLPGNKVVNVTGVRDSFTVVVQSPVAYLYISITANNSGSQLVATYSTTGCKITKPVSRGVYVQSPLYLPARTDFTCDYNISWVDISSGSQLALSFLEVSLPNATLNITSSSTGQSSQVSGSVLPPDVYSDDTLQLVLSVPKVNVSQKFSASLVPIVLDKNCGNAVPVTVTGTRKVNIIVPEHHAFAYDCRIRLQAATGKSLLLNITSHLLSSGGDRVTVVDGPSLGSRVLASLTEASAGYLVFSSGKQVIVQLVVDELVGPRSLSIDVTEEATSHHMYDTGMFDITPPAAAVSAPQYYLLEVAANSRVLFNLGAENSTEKYDYTVSVYDGPQISSPLLVTFSSKVRFPVMSTGNVLLLVAELTNTSQGLKASFSNVTSGCDQVTSASEGSFKLTGSSTMPDSCRWTITAQPESSATIMLDMTRVILEKQATLSVYSGVSSSGSLVEKLTANNTQPGAVLPRVAIPASQWAELVFSGGNGTNLTSVDIEVRFLVVDSVCGGQIHDHQGHIKSPGFPNLYPLNSVCTWVFTPSKNWSLLFFDFPQFQLADNHTLQFSKQPNDTSSQVVATFGGTKEVPSLLYESNQTNVVKLSAQLTKNATPTNRVAQGFDVEYWELDCGKNFTGSSINSSFQVGNNSLCVWIITLPAPGEKGSVNIINMTLGADSGSLKDMVKVHDGNSLRAKLMNISGSSSLTALSRSNAVIIVYNKTTSSSIDDANSNFVLTVKYTTFNCDKAHQCKNGICLHPDWRCNGKDDCGDNTDEQNCIGPPAPAKPSSGVKPFVVAVLFFVGLAVGIILAILLPRIIQRFRTKRYSSFRNEPEDA